MVTGLFYNHFVFATKISSYAEIWGIYISPEYWNMEIGTELINWGIAELKKKLS